MLLTAITTVLGLMPMVLAVNIDLIDRAIHVGGPSTQWWTQLATAVAGGLNLRVDDQDFESLIGEIGLQTSYAISTDFGVILPQFRGAYKHEFLNNSEKIGALFVQSTGTVAAFNIRTRDGDEDFFSVGAGASMVLTGGTQAFLSYDTVLGLDDISNHVITLGVRGEF